MVLILRTLSRAGALFAGASILVAPAMADAKKPKRPYVKVTDTRLAVTSGKAIRVQGTVPATRRGHTVLLQARWAGGWHTLDRDRTDVRGRFKLKRRLQRPLSAPVRIRARAGDTHAAQRRRTLKRRLNVYRTAYASWYGPGLYGNPLGCGGTLSPGTYGVAHKTLPCGTKVTLRANGRSVRVSVIDRGPYVGGREFDLTAATAQALGFSGHGPVQVTR